MRRRDFLKGSMAAVAAGLTARMAWADARPPVTWAPVQCLDLETDDMDTDQKMAQIFAFAREFVPQSNTGRPAFDPRAPDQPANERRLEGYGKQIHASELSIAVPNTYTKAAYIRKAVARMLAADRDGSLREILTVGLQFHTVGMDHPTDGVRIPPGFRWEWVMTVPHEVADRHRRAWVEAGYRVSVTPSVQLAADKVKARGWPTGWMGVNQAEKSAQQYTIMPDLRIAACRSYFLGRCATICREMGILNVELGGKSGWLHGLAPVRNTPATPNWGDPWLPSPYPGDSYRDANVALVKEAVAAFGPQRVLWTNTGIPSKEVCHAHGLPAYVMLRDGGIREIYDQWYGSYVTFWNLATLVKKGALPAGR